MEKVYVVMARFEEEYLPLKVFSDRDDAEKFIEVMMYEAGEAGYVYVKEVPFNDITFEEEEYNDDDDDEDEDDDDEEKEDSEDEEDGDEDGDDAIWNYLRFMHAYCELMDSLEKVKED